MINSPCIMNGLPYLFNVYKPWHCLYHMGEFLEANDNHYLMSVPSDERLLRQLQIVTDYVLTGQCPEGYTPEVLNKMANVIAQWG